MRSVLLLPSQGSKLIDAIALLLENISKPVDHSNIETAGKAFQALIELCAGNYKNQEIAYKSHALDSINTFLSINPMLYDDKACLKCS